MVRPGSVLIETGLNNVTKGSTKGVKIGSRDVL